jgi:hypothetical protein
MGRWFIEPNRCEKRIKKEGSDGRKTRHLLGLHASELLSSRGGSGSLYNTVSRKVFSRFRNSPLREPAERFSSA